MAEGRWHLVAPTICSMLSGGCQVEEALIDGFYGGISDTVATVIAEALLSLIQ